MPTEAVRFEQVGLWRTSHGVRKTILDGIDWSAGEGEHWGIVGPNGAGKTTLLRIASAQMRPSEGAAWVLGGRLGRVPLHELRRRIGLVEPGLGRRFYPEQRAIDVVLSGLGGTILLVDALPAGAFERAHELLDAVGAGALALRHVRVLLRGRARADHARAGPDRRRADARARRAGRRARPRRARAAARGVRARGRASGRA